MRVRTKLINCPRGMVKSVGGRLPGASGDCFAKKVREHGPDAIRDALTPLLDQIEQIGTQLRDYDKRIASRPCAGFSSAITSAFLLVRSALGLGAFLAGFAFFTGLAFLVDFRLAFCCSASAAAALLSIVSLVNDSP